MLKQNRETLELFPSATLSLQLIMTSTKNRQPLLTTNLKGLSELRVCPFPPLCALQAPWTVRQQSSMSSL